MFALIGVLVPGGIAVGGYAFLCSFAIAGLLAFKGFLLQIFGPAGSRGVLAALLVSGSYACGFWGQYSLDIDAWSQVAATPLLMSAWALIFAILTEPVPIGRDRRAGLVAALGLLIAGSLYFYPEGSVYNVLILLGVAILAWRSAVRQLPTLLGAFAVAWYSRHCSGAGPSALPPRNRISRRRLMSTGGAISIATCSVSIRRSINRCRMPGRMRSIPRRRISAGSMAPLTALLTGISGVLGVYFLTPEHYGAVTLFDAAKGSLLLLVLIGVAASVRSGLKNGLAAIGFSRARLRSACWVRRSS